MSYSPYVLLKEMRNNGQIKLSGIGSNTGIKA